MDFQWLRTTSQGKLFSGATRNGRAPQASVALFLILLFSIVRSGISGFRLLASFTQVCLS